MSDLESIEALLKEQHQEHVTKFWPELDDSKKEELYNELNNIDWVKINDLKRVYIEKQPQESDTEACQNTRQIDDELIEALPQQVRESAQDNPETLKKYREEGLLRIGEGKVAAILLAGGQGTRLGVDHPKGMFDVGCGKTLFQIQAERILELNRPTEMATGQKARIVWYIMTSEATESQTREFFEQKNYFGLDAQDVVFFEQNTLPCFSFDGKILLSQKHKIATSPDGNGGLYDALRKHEIIKDMEERGIEYVHVYCVDNILVRVCDPMFVGYCINKQVDAGAKIVQKKEPTESVGIICRVSGQYKVIEYSEVSESISHQRDESTGRLVYDAGNICDHFFKVSFLRDVCYNKSGLRHHVAIKKIPYVDLDTGDLIKPTEPNGVKLEKFIFDVFEFTQEFAVWEVNRELEFSPLKNASGSAKDNPITALKALQRLNELKETGALNY